MATDEQKPRVEEDAAPEDGPATDPETGSTPTDPVVDEVGLPPEGEDPMDGEAPSG